MSTWAICFDFPECEGEPWFAALTKRGALGITSSLKDALHFGSETAAINTLSNGYGSEMRSCGTVVEVAS